tara:strand:- start:588 stop:695 length:108 start_codon:yes stop_codon:yes gene_type:complete
MTSSTDLSASTSISFGMGNGRFGTRSVVADAGFLS